MDIVCPLGRGSSWNNEELRYALRSMELLQGLDKLYVIGEELPEWLEDDAVIRVPFPDHSEHADINIMQKVAYACTNLPLLSSDFLFINDDHFILSRVEGKFPYFFKNTLKEEYESSYRRDSPYKQVIRNTMEKIGHPALNFDLHCPIIYNTRKFMSLVEEVGYDKPYCIKSLYCAMNVPSIPIEASDFKIDGPISWEQLESIRRTRYFFSSGGDVHVTLRQFLVDTYTEKSRWEKSI